MILSNRVYTILFTMILGTILTLGSGNVSAQEGGLGGLLDRLFKGSSSDSTASDSTKIPKKALESYFFGDSVRKQRVFAWNMNPYKNSINVIEIDSVSNRFEVDYPFMKEDIGSAYLGNLGGASIPINFFNRPQLENFSFLDAYDAYLMNTQNVRFFNVKKPFTNLSYFMSGQTRNAEEQLRVTHAQNISPTTGVNIDYTNRGTKGMYSSQKAKDKNFSFALAHTGKRYSLHTGYIYNMGDIRENGGVQRDGDIIDTVINPTANVEVNLRDAKNMFKGNTFYITQAYGIPFQSVTEDDFTIANKSSLFFGHSFEYTKYYKKYTDTKAESGEFYKNWYIDPELSRDSINESVLDNKLFMQIQPWNRNGIIGTIDAGVGYSFHKYYNFTPDQYLYKPEGVNKNNGYVYGSVEGFLKKYMSWNAGLKYFPIGYRSQDLKVNAELKISAYAKSKPITLSVSGYIENRTPSYWDQSYFSNHFVWNNNFSKETETRLNAKLEIPAIGMEIGAWQSVTTDKIYYNSEALPAQYDGSLSVSGAYLMKNFKLGILRLNHRVLMQWSSNQEVAPVPLASVYASYFLEFNIVRNVLRLQLGVDGWYNTKYYAPGYMPATMQFYNQREKELGEYPFLDAFVSAKWKRMRILVKFQHLNEDMFGKREYFSVLHYPLNRRMLKLGFSWNFYD